MPSETDWREPILRQFTTEIAAVAPVTVAVDPDGLLLEQRVLDRLRGAGFELMPYDDPVSFRLSYESTFREHWAEPRGPATVVHASSRSADDLPYDLLAKARAGRRVLRFAISDLFPNLSPRVSRFLDRADFDSLWSAYTRSPPDQLGERATTDFILRHVFRLAPEMIDDVPELLHALLELHLSARLLPAELAEHYVEQLEAQGRFGGWPLAEIVQHRDVFLAFLQERWPRYLLQQTASGKGVGDDTAKVDYFAGPELLPFDHDSVRVYVDTMFLEGLLAPVEPPSGLPADDAWYKVGVVGTHAREPKRQLEGLTSQVRERVPVADATYRDWLTFAPLWGEWVAAVLDQVGAPPSASGAYREDWVGVQTRFQEWLIEHFPSLYSLSYLPQPPMVHHVPHCLRHARAEKKCALVVIDGMSFCQWTVIRDSLRRRTTALHLDERATFAWIPTITPVSRQALFSGEIPIHFADTIAKTDRDDKRWRRFWENHGLAAGRSAYLVQKRKEPDSGYLARIKGAIGDPRCEVVGLVVSTIDQSLHGAVTGSSGVQALAADWARSGHFANLIDALLEARFEVYISSDHGNTETRGIGKLQTGELSEGGERVHIFSEHIHRDARHEQFPQAIAWRVGAGLPDDYLPLIASLDEGFTNPGTVAVTHGGLTVEEVIVPFVRISRGDPVAG